jgi:hypothetical protein
MAATNATEQTQFTQGDLLEEILVELRVLNRQAQSGFSGIDDVDAMRDDERAAIRKT